MESQHRAVLATVSELVDPESIARRDRTELIDACRMLADWLRQYVEISAEQSAEIQRLRRRQVKASPEPGEPHDTPEGPVQGSAQGLKSSTA
jgi:hypothetical protein